jgi:hypothetical protein
MAKATCSRWKSTTGGIPSASTSNCASTYRRRPKGAIAAAYGLELPYRVLLTFDSEAAMRAVSERVRNDHQFAESEPYFVFNTLDRVKQDFARGWF